MYVIVAAVAAMPPEEDEGHPSIRKLVSEMRVSELPTQTPAFSTVFVLGLGPEDSGTEWRYQIRMVTPSGAINELPERVEQIPNSRPYLHIIANHGSFTAHDVGKYEFRLVLEGLEVAAVPLYLALHE